MDRVLALQGLSDLTNADVEPLASDGSGICSDASNGTGRSGCSIQCKGAEEMDW